MSRRSQVRNQYEATSTGELAAGTFSLTVDSTAGFEIDEPIYLALEPDVPGQREWVRVISITGNTFNIDPSPNDHGSTGRNLAGSDGDLTHPVGSKVRSVTTEQIILDIFQDQEDDELDLTQHETDGADPHASAGYLKVGDTDLLYVKLAGSTMTGDLILFQDPTLALGAATKQYVDDNFLDLAGTSPMTGALAMGGFKITGLDAGDAAGEAVEFVAMEAAIDADILAHTNIADAHHVKTVQTFLHDDLTDVLTDDHHTKYTDGDAVGAMGTKANSNDLNHDRYTDAEAVDAITSEQIRFESQSASPPNSVGGTFTVAVSTSIDIPNDWNSYRVIARGFAQYANAPGTAQMNGRIRINAQNGGNAQNGVVDAGGDPRSSPVSDRSSETADPCLIDMQVRDDDAGADLGTGKYANLDIVLARQS